VTNGNGRPLRKKKIGPSRTRKKPEIKWDDTSTKSVYANVCNVTGSREEFILLFGMNQAWHSRQKEVKVRLADRVVLNPFATKRLYALLGKMIREYEKKYGEIEI
jgi:hypothetical protein